MKTIRFQALFLAFALMFGAQAWAATKEAPSKTKEPKPVKILIVTSLGKVTAELDAAKAPISTKNFLAYVKKKQYDGTVFHRVIPGFMIQGGGLDKKMNEKHADAPIKNEATNGLKNVTGTLAMARTSDPDSASAQFFINVADNAFLDHQDDGDPQHFGYAVFGKVTKGMDVVHKIEHVSTATRNSPNGPMENVPVDGVTIQSIRVVK